MAETNGLLNRHTGITGIEGSNPSVSAIFDPILTDSVRNTQRPDASRPYQSGIVQPHPRRSLGTDLGSAWPLCAHLGRQLNSLAQFKADKVGLPFLQQVNPDQHSSIGWSAAVTR